MFNRNFVRIQSRVVPNDRAAFDFDAFDVCTSTPDTDGFRIGSINTRRSEPRNTPTMINAVFNNRNFWDSRAQDVFNGVNPFGQRDPNAVIYQNDGVAINHPVHVDIQLGSLASQGLQSQPMMPDDRLKTLQLQKTAVEALLKAAPARCAPDRGRRVAGGFQTRSNKVTATIAASAATISAA